MGFCSRVSPVELLLWRMLLLWGWQVVERCCSGPEPEPVPEPELEPKPAEEPSLAGPTPFVLTPSLKNHREHSLEDRLQHHSHWMVFKPATSQMQIYCGCGWQVCGFYWPLVQTHYSKPLQHNFNMKKRIGEKSGNKQKLLIKLCQVCWNLIP